MTINEKNLSHKAGLLGMIGAAGWVIGIVLKYALDLETPTAESALYIGKELFLFISMACIAFGYLGLWWGGGFSGRLGKIGIGMFILGYALLIVAGIFALFLQNDESPIFILFPIGGLLLPLGALLSGIAVARAKLWGGWQCWMPLIYAAYLWLAIELPFLTGATPDGPGMVQEIMIGIGLFLVGLAVYTSQETGSISTVEPSIG